MTSIDFTDWNRATGDLPWGVQRTFLEALQAVAENDTKMVWGSDYNANFPCLVNTVAPMLAAIGGVGGRGVPSRHFGDVVAAFDRINRIFRDEYGVNEGKTVSPLAADFLIANFGELKPEPTAESIAKAAAEAPVVNYAPEISDEAMDQYLLTMGADNAPDSQEQENNSTLEQIYTE